jgi:hypothetical protein
MAYTEQTRKRKTKWIHARVSEDIESKAKELTVELGQKSLSSLVSYLVEDKWDSLKKHPLGDKMVEKL